MSAALLVGVYGTAGPRRASSVSGLLASSERSPKDDLDLHATLAFVTVDPCRGDGAV